MIDLVALSRTIPIAALEHRLHLHQVIDARAAVPNHPPSWVALLLKAFALVAMRRPALRRATWFPVASDLRASSNVAAITYEREWHGEPAIFFDMLASPETMSLMDLHHYLKQLKTEPVESFRTARLMIAVDKWPVPIRRLVWRWLYSFSGPRRAKYMGTFAVNAGMRFPIRPVMTTGCIGTTLYFGFFNADGSTDACLAFDHRVMDGGEIVRTLDELQTVLNTEIVNELNALAAQTP